MRRPSDRGSNPSQRISVANKSDEHRVACARHGTDHIALYLARCITQREGVIEYVACSVRTGKVRAGLQQTGTRSAHRTLEQSSGRELRYVRDVLHRASNAIVDEPLRYECDVIAFEDLTHIRDRTGASWGHKWAFRTLYEQVEYKAKAEGISVKQVGSAYTSTRCAECGFTADENRPTRTDFRCVKCESEANADYNAAKNVGMRYVRRGQQSSRRTGNSQLALKSGTATQSGGFTAHPDGFEVEDTDKPHPQRAK